MRIKFSVYSFFVNSYQIRLFVSDAFISIEFVYLLIRLLAFIYLIYLILVLRIILRITFVYSNQIRLFVSNSLIRLYLQYFRLFVSNILFIRIKLFAYSFTLCN